MAKVIIIMADGFEEIEAITVIDMLRRADIEVFVLGLNSLQVRGAHNITIQSDSLLDMFSGPYDGVILPGGLPGSTNLTNSEKVISIIKSAYKDGLLVAAICAAPGVLGKSGILNSKKATCYPGVEKKLTGAEVLNTPVVRDGNIITSRGVATAIEFSLALITYLKGSELAAKTAAAILYKGIAV
jgi:4-methyl-5(b-hydroxyethyl)-thiazole monophosphate biosynthesis